MIVVQGGLVDGINSTYPQVQVAVIDLDGIDPFEADPQTTGPCLQGSRIQAQFGTHGMQSIDRLQSRDAEAILLASQKD